MYRPDIYLEIAYLDVLSWIFGNDQYDPDKPIYLDPVDLENSISRREAELCIKKLIAGFHSKGLRSGDSVCLHSFNNIYYALMYFAIIGAGGRFVGSNPAYTTDELNHLFILSDVRFILVEEELVEKIIPAARASELSDTNIFIFDIGKKATSTKFKSWKSLLEYGLRPWKVLDEISARTTTAALLSTSGTTGLPKAAEISHFAHVAQNTLLYDSREKNYEIRRLLCTPQFHAFTIPLSQTAPLREGHQTYIMRRYNLAQYVDYIERYQITETAMVNPIVLDLLALPLPQQKRLSSLRFVWVGGAPLDVSVQNRFMKILHRAAIVCQVWGMTEIGWITTMQYPEKDWTGSAGRLLPNTEAKIIDENLREISGEGVHGQILIRSPSIMTCYLGNVESTQHTVIDGWLHTGDIGYQNEGKWYIVDRSKELIKVRGWQVSPSEIEGCLLTHPAILDVAVIGVDIGDGKGELPRAYVVLNGDYERKVEDEEIIGWTKGKLANYKTIMGGIRRIEKVPRSASGKILKKILREKSKIEIEMGERKETAEETKQTEIEDIAMAEDGTEEEVTKEEVTQKEVTLVPPEKCGGIKRKLEMDTNGDNQEICIEGVESKPSIVTRRTVEGAVQLDSTKRVCVTQ